MKKKTNKGKKYEKPISLYGITPGKAIELFLKVRPEKKTRRIYANKQ